MGMNIPTWDQVIYRQLSCLKQNIANLCIISLSNGFFMCFLLETNCTLSLRFNKSMAFFRMQQDDCILIISGFIVSAQRSPYSFTLPVLSEHEKYKNFQKSNCSEVNFQYNQTLEVVLGKIGFLYFQMGPNGLKGELLLNISFLLDPLTE